MIDPTAPGIRFGIYPLGVAGTAAGLAAGAADDYPQIHSALPTVFARGGSDSRAEGA